MSTVIYDVHNIYDLGKFQKVDSYVMTMLKPLRVSIIFSD